jgi:hypothetical protein
MHLSRRVAAPLAGAVLALTVIAAPAVAAPRELPENGNAAVCNALYSTQERLPDDPFIQRIWSRLLTFFDCSVNPPV